MGEEKLSKKAPSRKRPCRICGKWFTPNPRVGDRQKTCGSSGCKKEWHRKKCAEWNQKNKIDSKSNYLDKKLSAIPSEESQSADKSSSKSKKKQASPIHVPLKSGIDPEAFKDFFSVQQAIVIEYIIVQIVRQALSKMRSPGK